MPKNSENKTDDFLRVIYRVFPEAEIIKRDGSREKLSEKFGRAIAVKSMSEISRESEKNIQQQSFDFGDNCDCQARGGT